MTRPGRARRPVITALVVGAFWASALTLTACGAGGADPADPAVTDAGAAGTLTVLAAASLTETFTELGDRLMASRPGLTVTFSFAGSSSLAAQITAGAPADVFAAASPAAMQTVVDADAVADRPQTFARNRLEIAVPPGNPGHVTGLADLARRELTVALCAPEVPCGAAAQQVLTAAGVTAAPDTLEQDVKAVLSKVVLGEVDAALVYRTDVVAAHGTVTGVEFPESSVAVTEDLAAVLAEARNPEAARAFLDLLHSADGRQVLADAGFSLP